MLTTWVDQTASLVATASIAAALAGLVWMRFRSRDLIRAEIALRTAAEERATRILATVVDLVFTVDERGRLEPLNRRAVLIESSLASSIDLGRLSVDGPARLVSIGQGPASVWFEAALHSDPTDDLRLLVLRDVTDRVRQDSTVQFQNTVLARVGVAVIATDPVGRIVYWNTVAEQIYGWSAPEVLDHNIGSLLWHRQQSEESLGGTAGGAGEAQETLCFTKSGDTVRVVVRLTTWWSTDGRHAGFVGVSYRSASDPHSRRPSSTGSAAELIHKLPIGAVLVDVDGSIEASNQQALQLLGWTSHEPPSNIDDLPGAAQQMLLDSLPGAEDVTRVRRLDGTTAHLRYWRSTPLGVGPVQSTAVLIRDDTELVVAQRSLQAITEQKRSFISGVAHKVRTPLTAIVGFADLFSREHDPDLRQEYVELVAAETQRLSDALGDLIVIGRKQADELSPQAVEAHLRPIIDTELDSSRESRSSVSVDVPSDIWVRADPRYLRHVIHNLLENASQHGGPDVTITARSDAARVVTIDISDNGPGIPQAALGDPFAPFVANHVAPGTPGAVGLGLPVARILVEQMGGAISHHEIPGRTTFRITIGQAVISVLPETEDGGR